MQGHLAPEYVDERSVAARRPGGFYEFKIETHGLDRAAGFIGMHARFD